MASSQQKSEQIQISNTTDALAKNTVSNALLDTLDAVIPENATGITDPGKKNANGSANETAESIQVSRTPEQIEEEKKKILTQVEYYFGDKNLPNDKFLNEVRSKNSQGWVPLKMICKFKKMQIYKDYDLIIEALRESPNLLEVDEQGEHVRRKTLVMIDIPQSIKDSAIWRSIYVKGFNKDEIDSNYEKEVASFFSQYSKVEKAFARREDDGTYKDSFFIQFATHEEAKKVSEMDLSYKNSKLTMMMKFDYCEMKCIEKGLDPNTMRLQKQPTKKEKRNNKWTPGCLLHFEGAGPNSTYLTIRMQMHNHFGDVRYVQYDSKNSSGIIEFEHPIAHKIIDSIPFENVEFDGIKPKLRVLKGNEEKDFYQKRKSEKIEKTKQSNALKAEFGINTEEDSVTNTNVRGKSRSRGNARGRRSGKKAEKQNTESSGQKIKTESQDEPDDNIKVEDDQEKSKKQNTESSCQKIKTESQDEPDDNIKVEEDQEKFKKPNTESSNQKRKMDEPDDDVSASGRSLTLTKKSRIGEIAPEVLPSSSERKRKAADLDDPDGTQGERPKSSKLDIANE